MKKNYIVHNDKLFAEIKRNHKKVLVKRLRALKQRVFVWI